MPNLSPFENWESLTLQDLVLAYRKAKADCFFERSVSVGRQFADYERNLPKNLNILLKKLQNQKDREGFFSGTETFGSFHLVPKKLSKQPKEKIHFPEIFLNPDRSFDILQETHDLTAEFRITNRFHPDFYIVSSLWLNKIGHRLDACLGNSVFGNRLRRFGDDGNPNSGTYHIEAIGSFPPYHFGYQKWRERALDSIQSALERKEKVIAVTLDFKNYFHSIDPSFINDPGFLERLTFPYCSKKQIKWMSSEFDFTNNYVNLLNTWRKEVISQFPCGHSPNSGVPIGVSACRVLANLLLLPWDKGILEEVSPIFYGRYVDDIILVLRDSGKIANQEELFDFLKTRLPPFLNFSVPANTPGEKEKPITLQFFGNKIQIQPDKCKTFFLEGQPGLDLLEVIRHEIKELSSERRLLPDPDCITNSPAAKVLSAAATEAEGPNALRKATGPSLRRLGWAIQLRNVETLAHDLRPEDWADDRCRFYRFAKDHVLRADSILEHLDYLPRLISIAIACKDFREGLDLCQTARSSLEKLRESESVKISWNGNDCDEYRKQVWKLVFESFNHQIQEALCAAWPWRMGPNPKPIPPPKIALELCEFLRLNDFPFDSIIGLTRGDLGRLPWKSFFSTKAKVSWAIDPPGMEEIQDHFFKGLFHTKIPETIREFFREARLSPRVPEIQKGAKTDRPGPFGANPFYLPLLFPTRPLQACEIAEHLPDCVGLGKNHFEFTKANELWKKMVHAFRGNWRKDSPGYSSPPQNCSKLPIAVLGSEKELAKPRIGIANFGVEVDWWNASCGSKPNLSRPRYKKLVTAVNSAIRANPQPHYFVLPELAIPQRWVKSTALRLLQSKISFISGVEYAILRRNKVLNSAVICLVDDRLGFPASVIIWQHKTKPAPMEEKSLLHTFGKRFYNLPVLPAHPVYIHNGFAFGLLICSELQDISFRQRFRGQIDNLFVISWNQDMGTFSPLVKSAALDIHSFVTLVNNRISGGSLVRSPAKKPWNRTLCNARGGLNDYTVVVELDPEGLRAFQSRAKNWPEPADPFKPIPQGFQIASFRKKTPR